MMNSQTVRSSLKQMILAEICRLAEQNGGQAPGQRSFEFETGITRSSWRGKLWATWSDALGDAGYDPNFAPARARESDIIEFLATAVRHFGRFPSDAEMRIYRQSIANTPAMITIRKQFPTRDAMISSLNELAKRDEQFSDLLKLLPDIPNDEVRGGNERHEGWVYLLKSGQHYKIGRSDTLERRVKQISVALPETATMTHAIKTDDPVGIESYWHLRFADKRANGEWFALKPSDVMAFKKRKYM